MLGSFYTIKTTVPLRTTNHIRATPFKPTRLRSRSPLRPIDKVRVKDAPGLSSTFNGISLPIAEEDIHNVQDGDLLTFMSELIQSKEMRRSFYVMNITTVQRLYAVWRKLLPRVRPYYAVKCNTDVVLIRLLHALGAGFDCASESEIQLVMGQGTPPGDIIFANPCKNPKDLATSRLMGIDLGTVDTPCELKKVSRWTPDARVLLRIRADDPTALFTLGKFGAEMEELPRLYEEAKALGIKVVGIAFHIGSQAMDPEAFSGGITAARQAFDLGLEYGFKMSILDIGGGFHSGDVNGDMSRIKTMAEVINRSLDRHFPVDSGIEVISEPGTYFAETCTTLACLIIGVRERKKDGRRHREYWITDGTFGVFHPYALEQVEFKPIPLRMNEKQSDAESISSSVYGPTLDSLDIVLKDIPLPELTPGDWLVFPNMGAYLPNLSTKFNGMHGNEETFYVRSDDADLIQHQS